MPAVEGIPRRMSTLLSQPMGAFIDSSMHRHVKNLLDKIRLYEEQLSTLSQGM